MITYKRIGYPCCGWFTVRFVGDDINRRRRCPGCQKKPKKNELLKPVITFFKESNLKQKQPHYSVRSG